MSFTISLSASSSQTVLVDYVTSNGTASAGTDDGPESKTGFFFSPGQVSRTVNVNILGDSSVEPDETFFFNLSNPVNASIADNQGIGTIIDDDIPAISINNASITEGDIGTSNIQFTISMVPASAQPVTVNYTTLTVQRAGTDYTGIATTSLTFAPGDTTKLINIAVAGDSVS